MRKASSRRPVMRKKPICSAKASLKAGVRRSSSMTLRSGSEYVKKASISKPLKSHGNVPRPRYVDCPAVHVLPPDVRHNMPLETANSTCLTGLGKAPSASRITERK